MRQAGHAPRQRERQAPLDPIVPHPTAPPKKRGGRQGRPQEGYRTVAQKSSDTVN